MKSRLSASDWESPGIRWKGGEREKDHSGGEKASPPSSETEKVENDQNEGSRHAK